MLNYIYIALRLSAQPAEVLDKFDSFLKYFGLEFLTFVKICENQRKKFENSIYIAIDS